MNERIKELAQQAMTATTSKFSADREWSADEWRDFYDAKFAELIVRMCAAIAQDFVTVENNKAVEKIHISPWHLQDKIKEHFGVEQ